MRGKIVNKHARYNLCFAQQSQEADYTKSQGTIVSYERAPNVATFRNFFSGLLTEELVVEGNYYYDINKCGIGYHGDAERRIVIATRLGATIPLHYIWYHNSKRISQPWIGQIEHVDIYIMSDKAVGTDWKRRSQLTLRHAAGCAKYTN